MQTKPPAPAIAASLLLVLAACSGGGGGGSSGGGGGGGGSASIPTITAQPAPVTSVGAGGTATLTIAAAGNGTLTYQWYFEVIGCSSCGAISGATTATLTLTAVNSATAGVYYCVVTNTLNDTKATATSAVADLSVVEPTGSGAITADGAVLPNTAGYLASVGAQSGVTYAWTISNGMITAGQGTPQITYSSGNLGQLQLTVTVSGPTAGTVAGVQNIVVVSALPIVSIFAQSSVLPSASGVLASTPAASGGSYDWTLQNGTASATIVGSSTADTLTYNVGATPGTYQLSVDVTAPTGAGSAAQTVSVVRGAFLKDVRDMAQRSLHTATLLMDGRVLFAGGDAGIPGQNSNYYLPPVVGSDSSIVATAELFDPVTTTWAVVGSLSTARAQHTATLLNDGRVLVAGGVDTTGTALTSTEIYSPATLSWAAGPSMATARQLASATLLSDGRVLVAGGANASGVIGTAEIFDPVADTWSGAGTLVSPRIDHSATLLPNGQVLAVGGYTGSGLITSTELYNPATNSWQAAASLPTTPPDESDAIGGAVLLASGQVLHLGAIADIYDPASNSWQPAVGTNANTSPLVTLGVEGSAILLKNGSVLAGTSSIYDPVMQSFESVPTPYGFGVLTELLDGRVLADGGYSGSTSVSAVALYDPTQNSWSLGGSQAYSGAYAASGVLANGQVLVTGGSVTSSLGSTFLASADLFNPATNTWTPAAPMSTARQQHVATVLANGNMLVTGGINNSGALNGAELYNPATGAWSSAETMSSPRYQHTASLLANGMVLVAAGDNLVGTCSCTTFVSSADLYNPATNSFTATGSLVTARYAHTATVLANGLVLVAGGFGGATSTLQSGGAALASAELYDPATGTWAATGSMTTARMNHTATLLPSGEVLVAGGYDGTATTASAEIYDPSTGTWSVVAPMNTPRQWQQAVLLPNGTALIVGGLNDASSAVMGVGSTEIYDPVANTWTPSGAMVTTRQFFVLNVLNDGRILLDGGAPNLFGLPEFYE